MINGSVVRNDFGSVTNNGTIRNAFLYLPEGITNTTFVNNGTLEALAGSSLTIDTGSFTNNGIIRANGGSIIFGGTIYSLPINTGSLGVIDGSAGTVQIETTLNNAGQTLALNQVTGSWQIYSGAINGGTVSTTDGKFLRLQGTLDGVTLAGEAQIPDQSFGTITNGLTFAGGSLSVASSSSLRTIVTFNGSQSITGSGTLFLTGTTSNASLSVNSGTLTIGPGVSLRATSGGGTIGSAGSSIVNNGTVSLESINRQLRLAGSSVSNNNFISVSAAGTLTLENFTNTGTLVGSSGGMIVLSGSWSNSGTIALNQAAITLPGTFTLATLGTLTCNAGTVNIIGTLLNAGSITLDANSGAWQLSGGAISGGTVATVGPATLVSIGSTTLDHVNFSGNLRIQSGSNLSLVNGASLTNATVSLNQAGVSALTSLTVPDQFDGPATIVFDGTFPTAFVRPIGTTLTIGPQVMIRTGARSGVVGVSSAANMNVINYGTISAETGGNSITISGSAPINYGTLQVSAGQLRINGNWNNFGTMVVSGGSLSLGGTFSAANVGTIVQSGDGKVRISGTYNNVGQNFVVSDSNNYWGLGGGTINGGTLSTQGAGAWQADGGTVNGVVINGYVHAGSIHVLNGMTLLNGSSISLDGDAFAISFDGSQTIAGNGEIRLQPGQLASNNGVATISSGITIRAGASYFGATSPGSYYNAGTISAQIAGTTLQIAGPLNNAGVVEARNGGTVRYSFFPANDVNGTLTGGTWRVFGNSTITFDTVSIAINSATILLDGPGSSFPPLSALVKNNQRLALSNGADLFLSSTLNNAGSISVDRASVLRSGGSVTFSGGTLDLNGGLSIFNPASTALTGTRTMLGAGFAGGLWTGPGLNSSAAASVAADSANAHKTAIGFARPLSIGMTSFFGKPVGSFNVVMLYTLSGDANLDTTINTTDFTALATNFGASGKTWVNGDFNYDAIVNALDFNALASNFGSTLATPSLAALVPEPMVTPLILSVMLRRRRRGNTPRTPATRRT